MPECCLARNQYSPITFPAVFFCSLILLLLLWWYADFLLKIQRHGDLSKTQLMRNDRCMDKDDSFERKQWAMAEQENNNNSNNKSECRCPDPLQPQRRPAAEGGDVWDSFHGRLVQDVQYSDTLTMARTTDGSSNNNPLDLVLLGDSITERWNGTGFIGQNSHWDIRVVFEKYFGKRSNNLSPLNGLALGTAGDISVELSWHVMNGMLPNLVVNSSTHHQHPHRPVVFLLLIGTNDLGRSGCSKRTTLTGILHVAQLVYNMTTTTTAQPQARRPVVLILHGLLPRSDMYGTGDYELNHHWDDILWINRELKKHAVSRQNWHYMDSSELFLQRKAGAGTMINPDLMPDALHPNAAGYDLWGARIVEHVQKAIVYHNKSHGED